MTHLKDVGKDERLGSCDVMIYFHYPFQVHVYKKKTVACWRKRIYNKTVADHMRSLSDGSTTPDLSPKHRPIEECARFVRLRLRSKRAS